MTGFRFEKVWDTAQPFQVGGHPVRVAALPVILEAKRIAGREKDLRFIEAYQARREEFVAVAPRAPTRKRPKK